MRFDLWRMFAFVTMAACLFAATRPPVSLMAPLGGAAACVMFLLAVSMVPFSYNIRNLMVRWKTTVMTALAFTLVVSLLTVMLAFVEGMARLTESSGQVGNVIILSEGSTDENFSNLGYSDVGDFENQPGILRTDAGVPLSSRETFLVVTQPIPNAKPGRPNRRFLQMRGLDDPRLSAQVHNLSLLPGGEWFSQAGVREMDIDGRTLPVIECVLGEGVARVIAGDRNDEMKAQGKNPERLEVGETLSLGDRTWVVVGVTKASNSTFDSEVWAKRSVVGPMFGKGSYSSLVVRTADADSAQEVKKFFNTQYTKASVSALIETEYFSSLAASSRTILYAIIFLACVMAVGGIFGVMNTMFAAISQRTKDIGVMRLMGFARWQILVSFLLESLAIGLIGGALGCLLGLLADGRSMTSIVANAQGGGKFVVFRMEVSQAILGWGILLSIVMGGLGGLLPSFSAMRLRPLESLR